MAENLLPTKTRVRPWADLLASLNLPRARGENEQEKEYVKASLYQRDPKRKNGERVSTSSHTFQRGKGKLSGKNLVKRNNLRAILE